MAGVAKNSGSSVFVRLLAIAIVVVWVGHWLSHRDEKPSGATPNEPTQSELPDPHAVAMRSTTITKFAWYKDGFGSVMMATFTIKNDGDKDVKDIEIKCVHSAPSGTVIDSNTRTIYEVIPAHKSRTFRNFSMGFINSQAAKSDCEIDDLALLQ